MRYRNFQFFVVLLVVFLTLPAYALKDYEGGKWEKGFYIGMGLGGLGFVDDNGAGLSSGFNFQMKIGGDVAPPYVAFEYQFSIAMGDSSNPSTFGLDTQKADYELFINDFRIKFSPLYRRILPYLVASMGWYTLQLNASQGILSKRIDDLHLSGGAGMDFYLTRRNCLSAEVVYHHFYRTNSFTGILGSVSYRFIF